MFDAIIQLGKKIALLDEDKILSEILDSPGLQAQIVDLNQSQLYDKGIQSDGSPTGEYAPITISYYKPLAASEGRDGRTDHITGKDTGRTYESMKVFNGSKGFLVHADDRNNFFDREPEGLGLTDESIQEILPEIQEAIIDEIEKKIFS